MTFVKDFVKELVDKTQRKMCARKQEREREEEKEEEGGRRRKKFDHQLKATAESVPAPYTTS